VLGGAVATLRALEVHTVQVGSERGMGEVVAAFLSQDLELT